MLHRTHPLPPIVGCMAIALAAAIAAGETAVIEQVPSDQTTVPARQETHWTTSDPVSSTATGVPEPHGTEAHGEVRRLGWFSAEGPSVGTARPTMAELDDFDNVSMVVQQGEYNIVNHTTIGLYNTAVLHQIGSFNLLNLVQDGSYNEAMLAQHGDHHTMSIEQRGDYNRLHYTQQGMSLPGIDVVQAGGMALEIHQQNIAAPER